MPTDYLRRHPIDKMSLNGNGAENVNYRDIILREQYSN
jgi:hypothetical protein